MKKLELAYDFPDLWNKINVSTVKISFTYEKILDDMKLNGTLTKAKIMHKLFFFKDIINEALLKTTNEVSPLVKSEITTLIYCVHIGSISVE